MRLLAVAGMVVALCFASCGNDGATEKFIVASEQANCTGVVPQKCLLIKKEPAGDWEFWYSGIKDFEYERGYEYVIKVRKEVLEDVPADRPSFIYVLDKVVSREKKTSANLPPSAERSN